MVSRVLGVTPVNMHVGSATTAGGVAHSLVDEYLFSSNCRLDPIPNLGDKSRRDMLTIHQMDFMTRACESDIK